MKPNITELVVQKELCIGCGVCAALCPASVLQMKWNKAGIYEPNEEPGCINKCRVCIDSCAFCAPKNLKDSLENNYFKDQNGLKFKEHLGFFYNTYEFYKTDIVQRVASASGGAGNFLLNKLIDLGFVDKIICVTPSEDDRLFKFNILDGSNLHNAKKSAYYPVTLDEVLDFVLKNDFKFAITTLPCYAASLRLAMIKNAKLRNRIKFIISLVCGQSKSKFFAQTSANWAFEKVINLKSADFRHKIKGKSSMQFGFKFEDENGQIAIDDRSKSAFKLWSSRAFTPYACNSCSDVFGRFADVSLMDAWLEDKISDYKGHSLVLTKNKIIDEIFKTENENFCREIAPDLVIRSQRDVIRGKLEYSCGTKNIFHKKIVKLKKEIQRHTNENKLDPVFLNEKCDQILKIQKLAGIMSLPKSVALKFLQILKEKI